ncbi:MAG: hypothetical protein EOM08_02275 [Clostridia bacterium]|nr:hypothetical protein [Clostridia bacterium]
MLKVTLLFTSKKLSPPALAGLQEYKKRLSQSCQLDWKTGVEPPATEEGELSATSSQASQIQYILLDRSGQTYSSPDFATQIQTWMTSGTSQLVFYVGLPKNRRGLFFGKLSLSPAALSSNTAGLLLAEQIYRAFRILEGKAYHK